MLFILFVGFSVLAAMVPLFVGASRGKVGAGIAWFMGTLCVPMSVMFVSFVIGSGSIASGSRAGSGLALVGLLVGAMAAVVIPAMGVSSITSAAKRSEARSRPRPRKRARKRSASSSSGRVPKPRRRRF